MQPSKLIVLRGPSGSGKSTVAKALRMHLNDSVSLVEQDYLRRIVLKEKDKPGGINAKLILQTVCFCLDHHYHVIVEGILPKKHYQDMFDELWRIHPVQNYVYYFDIPFKETLRRHNTKPNANDWGEAELRQWWLENDLLGVTGEQKILQHFSLEQTVGNILKDSGLE
jgi:adenylate kinase family enzyme